MSGGLSKDEEAAMRIAAERALVYRKGVPDRSVGPQISLDQAMTEFHAPLPEDGTPGETVIRTLDEKADPGLVQMCSPNYHGFVLGASHPIGVAADMLVAAWGQNAGSAAETPSMSGIERAVCDWMIDLLDLPKGSRAGICTGATLANTCGIMAARNALLARLGWDVEVEGLFGAPEITVLIGDDAHSAPFGALRYAGFGAGRAVRVATDDQGRIRPDAFATALAEASGPVLAVLQAGQINTGAFDPFAELMPLAQASGAWVHVDGAFGLWLQAVPELRARLKGVEAADSWAIDLHKWLNAPFDAGMVITRDAAPLVATMSARGAYLPDVTEHWEPSDGVMELSRRARGVPSYAILRHLGRSGVREMISRHCSLAEYLARALEEIPGFRVLNDIACNQVALRCGQGPEADAQTKVVLEKVRQRGKCYPSHGEWRGDAIIRVSIIAYGTQKDDIDLLISELQRAWTEVQQE